MLNLVNRACRVKHLDRFGGTLIVRLSCIEDTLFEYLAGQYLWLEVDTNDYRPFSIASIPTDGEDIELHIRLHQDSELADALVKRLEVENIVQVRLPSGECTLERISRDGPLLCIAGGTGLSACLSLVREYLRVSDNEVFLYWGVARREDLYFAEPLQILADTHPQLNFKSVIQTDSGLVHEAVLRDNNRLEDMNIFIAGSELMVDTVYKALIAAGAHPSHIFSDMLDLKSG